MRSSRPEHPFARRRRQCCVNHIDRSAGKFEPDLAPAGQFDLNLRQQFGIEQRAVAGAVAAIDPVTGA